MEQRDSASSTLSSSSSSSSTKKVIAQEKLQVIEWEDFEQEVARLWSLSSALKEAKEKKQSLEEKLQSLIQVKAESLNRSNELEEMREKLEARRSVMERMSTRSKVAAEDARMQEERLRMEVRSLLVSGTALSVARKRLQESNRLLAGERGYLQAPKLAEDVTCEAAIYDFTSVICSIL
ncbi:hypothetical protein Dsin_027453 [Dipteronia sinensis]|uniref:Uncharacterized protein n=1 Tax=Dipteronia sinensis TaxID=43782 RepID=A0AAD9ZP02_9ROSI|nr:hypothetical protein Dsin_027453 [Dipteronia sinensis]